MRALFLLLFTVNAMAGTCEGISRSPAIVEDLLDLASREIASKASDVNFDLFDAIERCDEKDIKKAIADGADVNATNDNYTQQTKRYTALTFSVKMDCKEATQLLIDNKADLNSDRSIDNNTALMLAARRHRNDIAKLLIDNGVDVNKGSALGRSVLNIAAYNNSKEIISMLLEKPSLNLNAIPDIGRTALGSALFMNNLEVVELILNHSDKIAPMTANTIELSLKWAKTEEMKAKLNKYLADHSQK